MIEPGPMIRRLLKRACYLLVPVAVSACVYLPADPDPRPAVPLSDEQTRSFEPRHPASGLELELLKKHPSYEQYRFSAQTYSESVHGFKTVEGEYFRSRRIPPEGRGPLIVIAPILGGNATDYILSRIFSRYACRSGMSAFFLYQEESILASERDGLALERLLRESIVDNRKILSLLAQEQKEVDPNRLGSFGISLGAIRNVLLVAVEPRLTANVLVMGGTNLADVMRHSQERGVLRYLARRGRRDGLSPDEICADIAAHFVSDPSRFTDSIAAERVLMVLARFDDKVPISSGHQLRADLGNPECYLLPAGHYTAILMAPYAASKAFRFLRERLGVTRQSLERDSMAD